MCCRSVVSILGIFLLASIFVMEIEGRALDFNGEQRETSEEMFDFGVPVEPSDFQVYEDVREREQRFAFPADVQNRCPPGHQLNSAGVCTVIYKEDDDYSA